MHLSFGEQSILGLTLFSALGTGLMGGVFFAFSTSVMSALARLPASQGIAAMQSINIAVINPLFMGALFGTAATCALLIAWSMRMWAKPGAAYLFAGGLLYLAGGILVTILFNVPLNEALAKADPASRNGAALWSGYVNSWTAWNHVRTVACLLASASLTLGFCRLWRDAGPS